jgi:hypothetical protein
VLLHGGLVASAESQMNAHIATKAGGAPGALPVRPFSTV